MNRSLLPALLIFAGATAPAYGQPELGPTISGEIPIELHDDWAYRSDDRANQNNDFYTKTEPTPTLKP